RARPAPGYPGLSVPCVEDHVLLVALHAAAAQFAHAVAFHDLALLFRSTLDHAALIDRARRWRLATAMFVALSALRCSAAAEVPDDLVNAFRPGPIRLALVRRYYRIAERPVAKAPFRLGWRWVVRQTPLRDDLARWCVGLARYTALRLAERPLVFARSFLRP